MWFCVSVRRSGVSRVCESGVSSVVLITFFQLHYYLRSVEDFQSESRFLENGYKLISNTYF